MKKNISWIVILLLVLPLSALSSGCASKTLPVVELSLWGSENDQELLEEMAASFEQRYADEADIRITVCEESEGTCRDTVLFSPVDAADVYTFADDQILSLAGAGALMELEDDRELILTSGGGQGSVAVEAASFDGKLYAYPLTASNGYFLYYDSAYFNEEDVRSMQRMLDIASANNKKICMDLTSGWYLYSFFKGAGLDVCIDEEGTGNICNFNALDTGIKGVEVARAIKGIAEDPGFMTAGNEDLIKGVMSGEIIAAVSGTWNENIFKGQYGNGYNATILPCYEVGGREVQMHSVMGYKLIGVNAYSSQPEWAKKLARWLTNEENQLLRFEKRGEGPADVRVAARPEIKESKAIAALAGQSAYGHLQRVSGSYWDPMYRLGVTLTSGRESEDDLQDLLDEIVKEIENRN